MDYVHLFIFNFWEGGNIYIQIQLIKYHTQKGLL